MRGVPEDSNASFRPTPLIRLGANAPIHLLPQGEKEKARSPRRIRGRGQRLALDHGSALVFGRWRDKLPANKRRIAMKKEVIEVPVMSAKVRALGLPCSTAVKANGFVFISATPPVDMVTGEMVRGDIETQTEASLKALKHCLEAAGTSLDNVVMVRIYAVNSGFYNAINRVYAKYFSTNPPARSFVPVASWPMEFDIEIECVAVA
jgi:2-iminobutanoate/2-iminopropanoate deaminase